MLLEKAWAKLNGSYESIISGIPKEVFSFFTPYVTKTYSTLPSHEESKEHGDLWEILVHAKINRYFLTCETEDNQSSSDYFSNGLLSLHAYSILDILELKEGIKVHRMIRVRDPWGKSNWKGDFSRTSGKWTNYLKSKLGFNSLH
jgi:hypothetical protein